MLMWWLPSRKGLGERNYFLDNIKGGYLNHGYLSWGFILKMPEVGAFSFPEYFLLVGTPSWRKLMCGEENWRKWGPSEKGLGCEIEASEPRTVTLVVAILQFVGHMLSFWYLDTAEPPL